MTGVWMDDQDNAGQPFGFAEPQTTPLGTYTITPLITAEDAFPPVDFTVEATGPRLGDIAPLPPENRDPQEPFESREDQLPNERNRDPREPIVAVSFSAKEPEFAQPVGEPVVATDRWSPPSGQPADQAYPTGGPSAASGLRHLPTQSPEAMRLAAHQAAAGSVPWGAPGGSPATAPMPWGTSRPAIPRKEMTIRAKYQSVSKGAAQIGVILQAIPWVAMVLLVFGTFFDNSLCVISLIGAWIIGPRMAKVGVVAINRVFMIAAAVYFFAWILSSLQQNPYAYYELVRWCCGILAVAIPVITWRALERAS